MLTKQKVLIVDDDSVSRKVLELLLKPIESVLTTNGFEALNILQHESVDLILLDIHMPGMDGFEVIERLKNNPKTKDIPIMFLTINDSAEGEIRALDLGAVDFIKKPFHPSILKKRVNNQLSFKLKSDLLEKHASLDGLTNILNRRMFDFDFKHQWAEGQRQNVPLGLIMIDIDHFKLYNDHYGHSAGDDVLIKVAQELTRALKRKSDNVYRYGGEEFVLIQANTSMDQLKQTAELLQRAIYDLEIMHLHSPHEKITVSLGAALVCDYSNHKEQKLLHTADEQLYLSKKIGRNCYNAVEI